VTEQRTKHELGVTVWAGRHYCGEGCDGFRGCARRRGPPEFLLCLLDYFCHVESQQLLRPQRHADSQKPTQLKRRQNMELSFRAQPAQRHGQAIITLDAE